MEIIFLTLILGGFIALALYISQIFKSKEPSEEAETSEDAAAAGDEVNNKEASAGKSKKKVGDKRQKEKNFTFQHPWLLSTLKGHSGRVLGQLFLHLITSGTYLE